MAGVFALPGGATMAMYMRADSYQPDLTSSARLAPMAAPAMPNIGTPTRSGGQPTDVATWWLKVRSGVGKTSTGNAMASGSARLAGDPGAGASIWTSPSDGGSSGSLSMAGPIGS